jgi:transposase-like protein
MHRCTPYVNTRIEQDHRGVKQSYYPMRGFGNFDAAARFCRACDAQRSYFRLRTTMRQRVPSLSAQRREYAARFQTLMREVMAA